MTSATVFRIIESDDADRARRLKIIGELDIASAPELQERLEELAPAHDSIRLDLSELAFADSTGISTILLARNQAMRNGWKLEIDPRVSGQVGRLIALVGLEREFWPPNGR